MYLHFLKLRRILAQRSEALKRSSFEYEKECACVCTWYRMMKYLFCYVNYETKIQFRLCGKNRLSYKLFLRSFGEQIKLLENKKLIELQINGEPCNF